MRLFVKTSFALSLVLLSSLTGCKKPAPKAEAAAATEVQGTDLALASPQEAAAKLGFAARLPADTEAYFSALNLPKHLAALKTSTWAKDVDAFIADKTPAPSAGTSGAALPDIGGTLAQLWGKDVFIALGKGGTQALQPWQEISTLNTELQYVMMMKGTMGTSEKKDLPTGIITQLLDRPDLLQRAAEIVTKLSLPPIMIGVQTDKPDEVLKGLVPDALLKQAKEKAKVSQMTTKDGFNTSFTIIEGKFSSFFTDEMKKAMLEALPAEKADEKATIDKALEAVRAKPFCLTYGSTGGWLIIALGAERPNLEFATDPSKSLLSRPEMSFALPYAAKNLVSVFFAEGGALQVMQSPEPLQPIARGVLAGLRDSPMFGKMAEALAPKVQQLAALERAVNDRKFVTACGAAWWDKGLHVELRGGQSTEGLDSKQPVKFAPLISDPNVVLGLAYHGDPEMTGKLRTLVEGWAEMLHVGAQELVKAGLGGKDGPTIAAWVEKDVIPPLVSFYDGSKQVFQKGTGNEHAWIADLGGQVPMLPIFPQAAPGAPAPKMLRLAMLDNITNRTLIGDSWTQMQDSLNKIVAGIPMLGMQQLPEPTSSTQPGGLNTYAYPLLPGADDFSPCASVSPSLFMLGTSITQHGELAARLLRAKPATENEIARWRINFAALRDAVQTFSSAQTDADKVKASTKWLAPLGDASGRMWIEGGNVRHSITVPVKDVVRYD
jgi:hypothetical protein